MSDSTLSNTPEARSRSSGYTITHRISDAEVITVPVDPEAYPYMAEFTSAIPFFEGVLVGKDEAIASLRVIYEDPIISNAVLLAPPGTGKTTLMQGLSYSDRKYAYVEADLIGLVNGIHDVSLAGGLIKKLFDELKRFVAESGLPLVIFIDEVHDVVRLSKSAAEAIKPALANSAKWGLRIVAATTNEEYRQYISDNLALSERFQRVSLQRPTKTDVIKALDSLAKKETIPVDGPMLSLMGRIFDVTEIFMPANNQPRKSLYTFSKMIAFHKVYGDDFDELLLAKVMRMQNIEINQRVDLQEMEDYIRSRVLDQDAAITSFINSVAVSIMKLNDEDEPRGSWLMSGPTGVGKALTSGTRLPMRRNGEAYLGRHGDVKVGDQVMNRSGDWVDVVGVYPQGFRPVYRLEVLDGRAVYGSDDHLWMVKTQDDVIQVLSLREMMNRVRDFGEVYEIPGTITVEPGLEVLSHGTARYNWVRVHEITDFGVEDDMQCIMVDDPEHVYMLANGLATHNTELVKAAAKFLFHDPNAFVRFDMTEYSQAESIERFRRLVTTRVWEHPFSIILFDEIEKAHGDVIRILMQVLDDGRLVDQNDRVVNFSNAYIFATTNLGSEIYEELSQYGGADARSFEKNVKRSITETSGNNRFPPELVNRFNNLVPFGPLKRETLIRILEKQIEKLVMDVYTQTGVEMNVDRRVYTEYLGRDVMADDTVAGGGRQVKRVLRSYIKEPVALFLAANPDSRSIRLRVAGKMAHGSEGDKFTATSRGRIEIERLI